MYVFWDVSISILFKEHLFFIIFIYLVCFQKIFLFPLYFFYSTNCRRVAAGVQPGDPGGGGAQAARVPRLQRQTVPRAAAARPAQDSAQEAAAPAHLRPGPGEPWLVEAGHVTPCSPLIGPGVEEDRGEADQVPGPGSAQLREPEEGLREASQQRGVQPQSPDLSRGTRESPDQASEAGGGGETRSC